MLIRITIFTVIVIYTMVVASAVNGVFMTIGAVIAAAGESRINIIYLLILLFFVISNVNILVIVVVLIKLACVT